MAQEKQTKQLTIQQQSQQPRIHHHPPIKLIPSQRDHSMKRKNRIEKLKRRMHRRHTLQRLAKQDDHFLEESITTEEDERTAMAKADKKEVRQQIIDNAHNQSNAKPTASITQRAQNTTYGVCTAFKRASTQILTNKK